MLSRKKIPGTSLRFVPIVISISASAGPVTIIPVKEYFPETALIEKGSTFIPSFYSYVGSVNSSFLLIAVTVADKTCPIDLLSVLKSINSLLPC
jgi:hypothetical protein